MKTLKYWVFILSCSLSLCHMVQADNTSADFARKQREMKAEHDRLIAESKRKFEQQSKQLSTMNQSSSSQSKTVQPTKSQTPKTTSFNATSAPAPADCLRAYITSARNAGNMDQILKFLTQSEQRSLKERQANYDPRKANESRQWHKKQGAKLDEATLAHLTNPPYVNELARHKKISSQILEVLSVNIEGNKAMVSVSTKNGATVNGQKFPYGTASIELIGENNTWKVSRYNDDNIAYLHPPQAK